MVISSRMIYRHYKFFQFDAISIYKIVLKTILLKKNLLKSFFVFKIEFIFDLFITILFLILKIFLDFLILNSFLDGFLRINNSLNPSTKKITFNKI